MPKIWNLPHLFVHVGYNRAKFQSPRTVVVPFKGKSRENPAAHIDGLLNRLQEVFLAQSKVGIARRSQSIPAPKGIYLEILVDSKFPMEQLESKEGKIKVRNVRSVDGFKAVLVYLQNGYKSKLIEKLENYKATLDEVNPEQKRFAESVEAFRNAVIEAFWTDDPLEIPQKTKIWCEVWLETDPEKITAEYRFRLLRRKVLANLNIEYKPEFVLFPERLIFLARLDRDDFETLIQMVDELAEIRLARDATSFWTGLSRGEQVEVIEELSSRVRFDTDTKTSVLVLDTGISEGHPLFSSFLRPDATDTVKPEWGKTDRDGHGTEMAAIAFYGDLQAAIESKSEVWLSHHLESCKILPSQGKANDPENYGYFTEQGIFSIESIFKSSNRVNVLAVSTELGCINGRPSSWSGTIDKLSFSPKEDDPKRPRLIILSAGNSDIISGKQTHPDIVFNTSIENPGQSWNAITVGGFTRKIHLLEDQYKDWKPIGQSEGLSPFSTSSLIWNSDWPNKPDVLFEAGNAAMGPLGEIGRLDDLSILTADSRQVGSYFKTTSGTSPAAAMCAWVSARLWSIYPLAWPETIRALIIHSADWSEELVRQTNTNLKNGAARARLLRIAGYGIVNSNKAWFSTKSDLTMIVEKEIQPFTKKGFNEIHYHELPWPTKTLRDIPVETEIKVRITLSYFIEPAPGDLGFKDKFRYQSFGLRFEMKGAQEKLDSFKARLNKLDQNSDEEFESNSESNRWQIGIKVRNKGSIHSDIWKGTVADLIESNWVAIYPVTGWWKQRDYLGRTEDKTRYSLVISLELPEIVNNLEIDIYNDVKIQNEVPIDVKIGTT